jgi:iron complex outermembrane recepter protein
MIWEQIGILLGPSAQKTFANTINPRDCTGCFLIISEDKDLTNNLILRCMLPPCEKFLSIITLSSLILFSAVETSAQDSLSISSIARLKKLSVEELMEIEVTSITMRPEKLTEIASAIQVITGEDIRRSGVTRLPESLRLASNLQIAQVNSHDWAVTARGFNGTPQAGGVLANKLLVMIDGRSIYNPLLGGVYWDVQHILLDNVDRIEVVSGPGGTLWGSNAVNGVINIITKSAKETQGLYVSAGAGSLLQDQVDVRYGMKLNKNLFARVYAQRMDQRGLELDSGQNAKKRWHDPMDRWQMTQGGFRMDYSGDADDNTLTLQGDFYTANINDSVPEHKTDGQNILTRFSHSFSEESSLTLLAYYDRTWRVAPNNISNPFSYELFTYDTDLQYRFPIGSRQSVLAGVSYRMRKDKTGQALTPLSRNMPIYGGFIQDEITIIPEILKLTVGSKFLKNIFTGWEFQPSARLAWIVNTQNTVWMAASRSVRTPTRIDSDFIISDQKFQSEKVYAYELGYRTRPIDNLSLSFAGFFNRYDDLRSLDLIPTPAIVFGNSQRAESWGFEFSASCQPRPWWRLRAGYTFFDKKTWATSDRAMPISAEFEGVEPKNQVMLQSIMDLATNFSLDITSRYVAALEARTLTAEVPEYGTFDVRGAWQKKWVELSVVGQNLLESKHKEFGLIQIPRSFYVKITCRF